MAPPSASPLDRMLRHRFWNVWVHVVQVVSIRRAIIVVIGSQACPLAVIVKSRPEKR